MKLLKRPLARRVRLYQSALVAILFAFPVVRSGGQTSFPYTLTSSPNGIDTSVVQVNLTAGNGYVPSWKVNGVEMLSQQVFYFSVGNNLPASSIDTMPLSLVGTNLGGGIFGTYAANGISIKPTFTLSSGVNGDGSIYFTLAENIVVKNTSTTNQTINFFQYSRFSLGNPSGNQTVNMTGSGTQFFVTQQTDGGTYPALQDSYQVNSLTATTIRQATTGGALFGPFIGTTPLDNSTFYVSGTGADYAFETSATLAKNQSFQISEFQTIIVPEPSSVTLALSGMLALVLLRRHQRCVNGHLVRVKSIPS
jgi:hypothetical protein